MLLKYKNKSEEQEKQCSNKIYNIVDNENRDTETDIELISNEKHSNEDIGSRIIKMVSRFSSYKIEI